MQWTLGAKQGGERSSWVRVGAGKEGMEIVTPYILYLVDWFVRFVRFTRFGTICTRRISS